jgi:hypothetical protein
MNPLFDMMNAMQGNAQANAMSEQLAHQFGLQGKQVQDAMASLMPAFSQGLQRNVASPQGFASFMQALASGQHAQYIQNPMKAFTPEGISDGNAILGHLFGSKEVSRAVAAQAEAASGISQTILKQMLPALAPMIMGSLFKGMTGQPAQAQQAFGTNGGILGQILEQMMKGGLTPQQQDQTRSRNPLEEILDQMMKGGLPTGQPDNGTAPGGSLGDIFKDMLKNGPMGTNQQQPADPYANDTYRQEVPDQPDITEPTYPKGTGLEDLFGELFKPSKQGKSPYEKGIESIFDQYLGPRR